MCELEGIAPQLYNNQQRSQIQGPTVPTPNMM